MVDIRLVYPPEKLEPASRLADALAAEGYGVERRALADSRAFPNLASETGDAKVVVLLWSRALVSAAAAAGRLSEARGSANLIEVSADGIEPVAGPEGSPVLLLCGWRGQPFHPGWQRLIAQVGRLCGPGEAPGKPSPAAAPRPAMDSAAPSASSRRPAARSALAAGALIAATLIATAYFQRGGPETRTEATPPAVAALQPAPEAGSEVLPPSAMAPVPPEPATGNGSGAPSPASAAPVEPRPSPAASGPKPRRAETRREPSRPKRLAAADLPDRVKRYSRKYSKTMRLFCQRSGRSTPQCRTFARSTRDLRG
ncbi:MAG TPA: hypothetical protein VFR28_09285 [Allosphingosinicella sp.]|jgi:hypothetical protein|nr:hypothetical protein [Allosphingosinicella sp.]